MLVLQDRDISLEAIWKGSNKLLDECGFTSVQIQSFDRVRERDYDCYWEDWHARYQVLSILDESYPMQLREVYRPPVGMFIHSKNSGEAVFNLSAWIGTRPIAVVGTRSMTGYGRRSTEYLVADLVRDGASSIISGFMYGVDTTAHRAAIASGGRTLGVLGYGFDELSSSVPSGWLKQFLDAGGVLLSEYPPDTPAVAGRFVARNRIVAGLSAATLVVEAGERSGSHITAKLALENGRTVGAVPGPISNQFSEGTKHLINQGAVLVSRGLDLLNGELPLY